MAIDLASALKLNPAALTPTLQNAPAADQQQLALAAALANRGSDTSPIQSKWQGLARLADAVRGGLEARDVQQQQANSPWHAAAASLLSGGAAAPGSTPARVTSAPAAAPAAASDETAAPAPEQDASAGPSYLDRVAQIETGGNPNQTSSTGAMGKYQFVPGTWAQYGGGGDPNDPVAQEAAVRKLTADNAAALAKALGREPTAGELYLAHQQGAGGATALLTHPDQPAGSLVSPKAIAVNGGDPNAPAGQFVDKWTSKFANVAPYQVASASPDIPTPSAPGLIDPPVPAPALAPPAPSNSPQYAPGTTQVAASSPPPSLSAPNVNPLAAALSRDGTVPDGRGGFVPATNSRVNPDGSLSPGPTAPGSTAQGLAAALAPASGSPAGFAPPAGAANPRLQLAMAILADPRAPAAMQQVAGQIIQAQFVPKAPIKMSAGETLFDPAAMKPIYIAPDKDKDTATPDVKNYEYAKKNGYQGSFTDYETSVKKAGATSISNTVDMAGEKSEEQEMGKAAAKRADTMLSAASSAPDRLARVAQLRTVLSSIPTGPDANIRGQGVRWAKAVGISDDTLKSVGLDPNQATANEIANKIRSDLVLESIGSGGMPANNFSDADRRFLENKFPNLSNQPGSNEVVADTLEAVERRKMQMADEWDSYRAARQDAGKPARYSDFESAWRRAHGSENVLQPIIEKYQSGGYSKMTQPASATGGERAPPSPAGRVRTYNPATGRLE